MQLHQVIHQVDETNTRVLGISVDGADNANAMKEKSGVNIDILCDENLEVIKLYSLEDEEPMVWDFINGKSRKSKEGRTISLSANILINQNGTVVYDWRGHYNFRPSHEATIEILKKL